jgi:hypothetical protein
MAEDIVFRIKAEASKFNMDMHQAAKSVNRLVSEERALERASKALSKGTVTLEHALERTQRRGDSFAETMKKLSNNLALVGRATVAFYAIQRTGSAMASAVIEGNKYSNMMKSLKINIDDAMTSTGNLVDRMEMVRMANQATAFGISKNSAEFERIAKASAVAAQRLGIDFTDAMSRVIRGVGKLEVELLDELGVRLRVNDVTRKAAIALNKNAKELTDNERMAAMLAETLRKLEDANKGVKLSTDGVAKNIIKTSNAWKEFRRQVGMTIDKSTTLAKILGGLSAILRGDVKLANILGFDMHVPGQKQMLKVQSMAGYEPEKRAYAAAAEKLFPEMIWHSKAGGYVRDTDRKSKMNSWVKTQIQSLITSQYPDEMTRGTKKRDIPKIIRKKYQEILETSGKRDAENYLKNYRSGGFVKGGGKLTTFSSLVDKLTGIKTERDIPETIYNTYQSILETKGRRAAEDYLRNYDWRGMDIGRRKQKFKKGGGGRRPSFTSLKDNDLELFKGVTLTSGDKEDQKNNGQLVYTEWFGTKENQRKANKWWIEQNRQLAKDWREAADTLTRAVELEREGIRWRLALHNQQIAGNKRMLASHGASTDAGATGFVKGISNKLTGLWGDGKNSHDKMSDAEFVSAWFNNNLGDGELKFKAGDIMKNKIQDLAFELERMGSTATAAFEVFNVGAGGAMSAFVDATWEAYAANKNLGEAMEQAFHGFLKGFGKQMYLKSLEQTALGLAALVLTPQAAGGHFAAAGVFATAAALAGAGARATAPKNKPKRNRGVSRGRGGVTTEGIQAGPSTVTFQINSLMATADEEEFARKIGMGMRLAKQRGLAA